jgi:hypothetical protein
MMEQTARPTSSVAQPSVTPVSSSVLWTDRRYVAEEPAGENPIGAIKIADEVTVRENLSEESKPGRCGTSVAGRDSETVPGGDYVVNFSLATSPKVAPTNQIPWRPMTDLLLRT